MKTCCVLRGSSGIYWHIRTLSPNATGLERGCVQSTSHSTLKSPAASGVFQQAGIAKLLRLVPLCGTQPRSGAVCPEFTADS
jgi:hypothetical protein